MRDEESISCAIDSHVEGVKVKTALLVVDNCEHVAAAAAAAIQEVLQRHPRIRVLATSRQPLNVPKRDDPTTAL